MANHAGIDITAGQTTTDDFDLEKEMTNNMWIDRITFIPAGKNFKIIIRVVTPQPVEGASLSLWLEKEEVFISEFIGTTDILGEVTFMVKKAEAAEYLARVTTLFHGEYIWDQSQGIATQVYHFPGGVTKKHK